MDSRMAQISRPMVDYLLGFRYRLANGIAVDFQTLRGDLRRSLERVTENLHKVPEMHTKQETIRYLLVGLADEVVLSSKWDKARQWREQLLEMEIFNTSVAGERFFELLEKDGYRDSDLAELFYICLLLGFRGRFQTREAEVVSIKQRVYAALPNRLPEDERRLTPGAEIPVPGNNKKLPRLFGVAAVAIVLVVALLGYLVTSQWMWNDIAATTHEISKSLSDGKLSSGK